MGKKKPIKTNKILPRHEVFVKALAAGEERADAYVKAYPKSGARSRDKNAHAAFKLLQRPEVMSAYEAELATHREREKERNRWTYERSIQERMNALEAITEERERRRNAQEELALAMIQNPPEDLSPEQALIEAKRILMQPILSTQTTTAVAQLCDGLDKLTGLQSDNNGNTNQINLIFKDPRRKS